MIFISIILFVLTMLIIFYPLFQNKTAAEPTLQDVYTKNYLATEARLKKSLDNGVITQTQYDQQQAEAARDLLKLTQKHQSKLSNGARTAISVVALIFPVAAIGGFWAHSYTQDVQEYDQKRSELTPELQAWLDRIPESELETFKSIVEVEPQPPKPELFEDLRYVFPTLFYMSAKQTHDNPKLLKLLGKLAYSAQWTPGTLDAYNRVLALSPNDYIANVSVLEVDLQNAKKKIPKRLVERLDHFFTLYPNDTYLRILYAEALYERGQFKESIAQWKEMRDLLAKSAKGNPQGEQALKTLDTFIASIEQGMMETAQVRNFDVKTALDAPIDWQNITSPLIMTLYMMDFEDNTPIAFKESLIAPNQTVPAQMVLNDFNRFDAVTTPIRNFEHLAVFGTLKPVDGDEILYLTDVVELPKGAYESAVAFMPSSEASPINDVMQKTIDAAKAKTAARYLVQVNAPDVNLSTLPESARLTLFISQEGSRMPLAAKAIDSANSLTFPLTIEITDQDRLMAGNPSLFATPNLTVGARLSQGSEAVGQAGDIESVKMPIAPEHSSVILTLDQIRETSKTSPVAP